MSMLTRLLVRLFTRSATPGQVAEHIKSIQQAAGSRTARLGSLILPLPEIWKCRKLRGGGLVFLPSALGNGVAIQAICLDAKEENAGNTAHLMRDIEEKARQRSWTLRAKNTRHIAAAVEAVDVIAEAKNAIVHRFVNFYYAGDEYFVEVKADTPSIFDSTTPVIDAWIDRLAFR